MTPTMPSALTLQLRVRAHRPSGLFWAPSIPADWSVVRLKATITGCWNGVWGEVPGGGGEDVVCVRVADFDRQRFRASLDAPTIRSVPHAQRGVRSLRRGDLLLEKSGGGEKQPVGAVVLFDDECDAVCSNFVARVELAPRHHPEYLTYLHASLYSQRLNVPAIKQSTGIQNLDADSYFAQLVPLPSYDEQRVIAAFLSRELSKVDALIAKKERLLELLAEARRVIISDAVSAGHWHEIRLKHLVSKIGSGKTPAGGATSYRAEGIPLVRSQNVHFDGLRLDDVAFIDEDTDADMAASRTWPGDVLLNITGASLGRVSIVPPELRRANVNQHVCIVRPMSERIQPGFLRLSLTSQAVQEQIFSGFNGVSRDALTFADVGELHVRVPATLEEQQDVVQRVDVRVRHVDGLAARVRRAIGMLHEYRSALITAGVTGQIDVRDHTVTAEDAA